MFKCGFFNSINGDRKYNAEEMNNPYFKIISNGVFADDKHSNDLQVESVNGLIVKVNSGKGMFFNKWAINDSDLIFTIPTPPILNTRIDSLIVSVDISESERKGVIEYRKGDNLETPYPPELINTEYRREYRLANITVRENVKEITQADIEDTRPTKECGFITNLLQDSDITATYKQWEKQFELWFNDIKSNLINHTLLLSLTNTYVTETEAEKNIKINIPSFTSQLDILEVYINGLKLINNIDYVVNGFEEIILTLPVDKGTQIEFILYKSVDSSDVESIKDILIEINNNIQNLNNDIFALEEEVATNTESINTNLQSINANKDNIDLIKRTYANLVKSDSPTLNNLNTYIEAGSFFGRTITDFETLPEQFTGHDLQYAIIFVQRGTDFAKQNLSFIDFTDNKHFDLTRGLLFNGSGMIQGSTPWQSISIESETATFSEGANTDKLGNVIDETYAKKSDIANVYKYKGSVATEKDLPKENNKIGDVYDVQDTGMNFAWDGTKWDELGFKINIDEIIKLSVLASHPVGTFYWTELTPEKFNPNVAWGGTWVRVQDKIIVAKGSKYTKNIDASDLDGNGEIKLSVAQLPSHSHNMEHRHDRGDMNISGAAEFRVASSYNDMIIDTHGALYKVKDKARGSVNYSGTHLTSELLKFDANKNWSGHTSSTLNKNSPYSSKTNTDSTGSTSPIKPLPPIEVAYCWKRTA